MLEDEFRDVTALQRDVLAVAARHPHLPLVHISGYSHVAEALDPDRMRRCVELAHEANDALRLRFHSGPEGFRQSVADTVPALEVVDLSAADDPAVACREWMREANGRPPAEAGPPLELALLIDGPGSHYLYGRLHHAAGDAWALNLLFAQILGMYESATPTAELAAAPMPSFLDHVARERAYRDSDRWREDRQWFLDHLGDAEPALFTRTAALDTVTRTTRTVRVDPELAAAIRATGLSMFSVTAAALAAHLARVHGVGEVVLGVPMLNRAPADLATVGDFANMLPLRVPVAEAATLLDVARRVADQVRALKPRQGFALGDIVRALAERTGTPPTLFDVTYSYSTLPAADHLEKLLARSEFFSGGTVADAVNIIAVEHERDGTVDLHLFASTDVFDADFPLADALRRVTALLRNALAAPDVPLRELDALPSADRRTLAAFEPGPTVPFPGDSLDRLFTAQAARTPDAPAVRGADGTLTYADLRAAVERLAAELAAAGVRADEPVPVVLPRSPELLVAIWGVLRAGAAYVPVDPAHPAERIATVLTQSGARLAITADGLPAGAVPDGVTRVPVRPEGTAEAPESTTAPGDLAYVLFTSGSTGTPKGVMIEHRPVVNRLAWMQRRYPLGADDVILQKTPATFDVSVWELMWWALTGASVALLAPGAERDPRRIVEAIETHRVTVLHFVPSMLGPFLDELAAEPAARRRVASLRRVFCSGEALPAELVTRFAAVFGGTADAPRLVNLYGPTEATVDVSWFDCPADPAGLTVVPIGRPIDNIDLLVLDEDGRRVPPGVAGELNIAGVGLARGYLGRPDLTAAAFVEDPAAPGGRRYRTGDIARWLADGTLEYLGRRDDQVKIRGNRVTLGEVENTLLRAPGVRAAAVLDQHSEAAGTHLVGYFVPAAPGVTDANALAAHLSAALPPYMVPSRFVALDRIPLTPNGKLDRRALAAAAPAATDDRRAPSTPAEAELVRLCTELLGAPIGVDDNFFTHGGDSILALALRTAAERHGLHLDLDVLFTRPTIAALAASAGTEAAPADRIGEPFAGVALVDRAALAQAEDAFAVGSLQLGMLFHAAERAESTLYKDVFRYRLRMPWQEGEFRAAADRLAARQPALRSTFDLTGFTTPLQIVHPAATAPVTVWPGADEDRIAAHIEDRRRFAYDIAAGPLWHLAVFPGAGGTVELVLSFHHAVLDGWSVATVVRELVQDYLSALGFPLTAPVSAAAPSTVLAEYVRDEQRATAAHEHARYWRATLDDATPTQLRSFTAHLPAGTPVRPRTTLLVPSGTQAAARRFAAEQDVTVKTLLLTAHCLALGVLTGATDTVTGVIGHARPGRPDAETVAGLFLNTLPLRLDGSARTWREAVDQVAAAERAAVPHRRYPLRAILADRAAGGRAETTLFDTAFNYVHYHQFSRLAGIDGVELLDFDVREETNFAALLTVAIDPRTDRMLLRVDGDADTTPEQCALLASTCLRILECLLVAPDEPIDRNHPRIRATDVVSLTAERAARTPDAIAVRDDEGAWTYGELAEHAGRITADLLALGLAPQARVGVLMDRGRALIATVLAVARAGAVVVPLDPNYPEQRLRRMLDRSAPARVVAAAAYADLLPDPAIRIDPDTLGAGAPAGPLPLPHPESAAYVLFTSGSTGEPKGVVMPHRALANLVEWQNGTATGAAASTLQYAPLSFDVSFQEIWATLAAGGLLRLAGSAQRSDMAALLDTLVGERIERLFLPFVALQALAETAVATERYPTALRVLISSGEQLRVTPEIRELCRRVPGLILENQYGPTETHVTTAFAMTGAAELFPALPPIGRAVDGATVHLLDRTLRPVPDGVEGEIYLGGVAVATGYEGRGDLTATRFVPAGPGGERVYRTGDLGIRLGTGDIVCRGRADAQVKIRGYRVEPAEVELQIAALAVEFPGITESAVVARTFGGIDGVLTAFLVGDEAATDVAALRTRLGAALPAHMVPTRFAWLDAVPRTPSGKRDDRALRDLDLDGRDGLGPAGDHVAPRDEIEAAVAEIMAEFAGVPALSADQDFFDAGGTSVGAMRVVLSLNRRWDTEIPLDTFVKAPTAAALAAIVRNDGKRRFDPVVALRRTGTGAPLFLVHPIGGNVLCYLALTKHLPAGRPVYGLQAAGADIGSEPLDDVTAMAAAYLAAIRRVHPEGPIHLAGWSFGGYVALEMARQLDADEVASLTLLDTIALRTGPREAFPADAKMRWFFQELLWYARGAEAADVDFAPGTGGDDLFAHMLTESVAAGLLPPESSERTLRRLFGVFDGNATAIQSYRMTPLDRDVTLLRAAGGLPPGLKFAHTLAGTMFDSDSNGWDDLVRGDLDIVTIPGDHLDMMTEPHVAELAATLGRLLTAAEPTRTRQ
ncbi:amino acid adenylation domain-containing protein [Nocardia thailandica]|uniref:Amino acid adenylation domain-containing protein n=1 Tax=Nocardia thailandica TaxID=257275 RepID=A0ABW6PHJ8_9NOCA